MAIPNLAAGQAAIVFGALGPNFAVSSACASGGHALGEAWEIIRRGDADVMIAGSSEAGIHEVLVGGFAAMRALSTRNDDPAAASRPFDRGRDGFVIGEGAGVVILETLEHATARGAEPLAELVGYGASADASHITLPAPGGIGAARAIRRALEKAGLSLDDVEHVNAHATSTPEGDRTELEMLRTLFGDRAGDVSVTANKSMLGHTLGAAGSIEAAITVLSLREGVDPADDQPRRPRRGRRRPRPHPERGPRAADPRRGEQLVRVRRPEQRPGADAVGRMTDALESRCGRRRDARAGRAPSGGRPGRGRRWPGPPMRPRPPADASLLALVDRLAGLLERSDLLELEVEAGGTGIVLRKAAALAPAPPALHAPGDAAGPAAADPPRRGRRGRRGRRAAPRRRGSPSSRPSPASSTPRRAPGRRRSWRWAGRSSSARSSASSRR